MSPTLALFLGGGCGWAEVVVLGLVGLLVFGRRLPEVGKSLGKGIVEFKKGLKGIEDEIESSSNQVDSKAGEIDGTHTGHATDTMSSSVVSDGQEEVGPDRSHTSSS